jgi:hypothetical protein
MLSLARATRTSFIATVHVVRSLTRDITLYAPQFDKCNDITRPRREFVSFWRRYSVYPLMASSHQQSIVGVAWSTKQRKENMSRPPLGGFTGPGVDKGSGRSTGRKGKGEDIASPPFGLDNRAEGFGRFAPALNWLKVSRHQKRD